VTVKCITPAAPGSAAVALAKFFGKYPKVPLGTAETVSSRMGMRALNPALRRAS